MADSFGKRIISLIDWCWPFPLGIVATALALGMSTGIWLAVRSPQPPSPGQRLGRGVSTETPAQAPGNVPPPGQVTAPAGSNPITDRTPSAIPAPAGAPLPSAPIAKPQVAKPKTQPPPVARKLSATQQAEITDRLTIGRFLMERKEYSAAIKEFQAALAIDPSSREAQEAIQTALKASK